MRGHVQQGLKVHSLFFRVAITSLMSFALCAALSQSAIAGSGVWTQSDGPVGGDIRSIVIDPSTSTTLYVGLLGSGVFKSVDNGASWAPINTGLETALMVGADLTILSLAVDPVTPNTMYAGTIVGGLYKSIDGGAHWARPNSFLKEVYAIVVNPLTPSTIYAGSRGGGVCKGNSSAGKLPVLKGKVNGWLRQKNEVLAFCSCRPTDGGTGAVYVLLRRPDR